LVESRLRAKMGLDIVELFMHVEKEFELSIPDATAAKLETVGLLYDHLCRESPRLRGHATPGVYSGWAWDRLVQLVAALSVADASYIRPEAFFVRDLGMG
jgi:hypothetical protein